MKRVRAALLFGSVAMAAACVPRREPPPPPPQQQQQLPKTVQAPPPPPPRANWQDLPLTPGSWSYRADGQGSVASFGQASGAPIFTVRCDPARRQVTLGREGAASGSLMTIRTSYSARNFPLSPQTQPAGAAAAAVPASDPFLDRIVFSRGRFTVETPGAAMLIIPAWPEPARVLEDCRS